MGAEDSANEGTPVARLTAWTVLANRRMQFLLDRSTPHVLYRWLATGGIFFILSLRILCYQGFYVVAYALGIYLLNLLLLFLSPRFDPSGELFGPGEEEEEGATDSAGILPVGRDDEFRPFVRRLPEFRFWHNGTRAILVALGCTLFPFLDIPVFWPILVFYFIILTVLTMRRQIAHMIKHRYVPFDFGKKTYATVNNVRS